MKVLFAGTQPITSPKQEKQNKPASNQNPYSSHPQQNAVFSGTYPPNYNVRFGMPVNKPPSVGYAQVDISGLKILLDEVKYYKGCQLRSLWRSVNSVHRSRMVLAKHSPSEHYKDIKWATNHLEELEEHIKSGDVPENQAIEETHKPLADDNPMKAVQEAHHGQGRILAEKYPKDTPDPIRDEVNREIVDPPQNPTKDALLKVINNYNKRCEEWIKPSAPSGTSSEVTGAPSGSGTQ